MLKRRCTIKQVGIKLNLPHDILSPSPRLSIDIQECSKARKRCQQKCNALQAIGVIPLSGVKGTYTQLHAIFDLKNLQNSSGSTSRRREISLGSFEHIDLISMVDKV